MTSGVLDINSILQNFGVWGLVLSALAGFFWLAGRGIFTRAKADSDQQSMVTQFALKAQARTETLGDQRYQLQVELGQLRLRMSVLEADVKRIPQLESEVRGLREALQNVTTERDIALKQVEDLKEKVQQLESDVRRFQNYELRELTLIEEELDIDRTRPLIEHSDITGERDGAGGDGRRGSDSGDDSGKRDGG